MHPLERLIGELCGTLSALEPGTFTVERAATLAERLAAAENACAVAKTRLASRAAAGGAHRARGHADASDWMASVSGATSRESRRALEAVAVVETCPDTHDAMVKGEVSLAQAGEIARAEAEVRGCEHELLELARRGGLGAVRNRARMRRLEAADREELHRRQVAAREFRHWVDGLGMVCGSFRLPPLVGRELVNRIERTAARLRREPGGHGRAERYEARAADALVASTARSTGPTASARRREVDLVIVQSAEVARRGHVHAGELCHIVGGGPVAPSVVEQLAAEAFVKAVLHDGKEVTHVAHHGRHLTAEMRTARGIGRPPEFAGRRCAEPGCERRLGLETDHVQPFAKGGPTSGENLQDLCIPHHWAKTERDRAPP